MPCVRVLPVIDPARPTRSGLGRRKAPLTLPNARIAVLSANGTLGPFWTGHRYGLDLRREQGGPPAYQHQSRWQSPILDWIAVLGTLRNLLSVTRARVRRRWSIDNRHGGDTVA